MTGFTDLERQIIQYGFFRQQKRTEEAEEAFQKLRAALIAITAASEKPGARSSAVRA